MAITLLLITCCLSYGERRFALYLYSTCRTALALLVHPSTAAIRHTRRVSRRVLHKILFSDIQKKWNKIRMIFRHWSKSLYAACRQIVRANKCLQCLSIALSRVSIFCKIIIMASFDTKHSEHQFCILTTITYLKIIVMTASLTWVWNNNNNYTIVKFKYNNFPWRNSLSCLILNEQGMGRLHQININICSMVVVFLSSGVRALGTIDSSQRFENVSLMLIQCLMYSNLWEKKYEREDLHNVIHIMLSSVYVKTCIFARVD